MIVTVTLNPAVDKSAHLEVINKHSINRLQGVESDAGGKGINISRTIKRLNRSSIATGFLGGSAGTFIHCLLEREGIDSHMIDIIGNTRTNLKIFDGEQGISEFNEEGPFVLQHEMDELTDYLRTHLSDNSVVVLAGSLPQGVSQTTYSSLIEVIKEANCLACIDTNLTQTSYCLDCEADIVKLNAHEIQAYYQIDHELDEKEILYYAHQIMNKGVGMMIVPNGYKGIYLITHSKAFHCSLKDILPKSRAGASDAFIAGVVVGLKEGMSDSQIVQLATTSYGATLLSKHAYPISYESIEALNDYTVIREL